MKKLICLLTATVLSSNLCAQAPERQRAVAVSFGRYGSDCSSGRGTCSFSVSKNNSTIIPGKNFEKTSENSVLLQIQRSALTKDEEVCMAGTVFSELNPGENLFFVQMDDLIIDAGTLQNLGIDTKYNRIAAGNYLMSVNKDKVEINFTFKDPNDVKP